VSDGQGEEIACAACQAPLGHWQSLPDGPAPWFTCSFVCLERLVAEGQREAGA
jgi:hypothetical protein